MRKVDARVWASRRRALEKLEKSGLCAAAFCRREGIAYGALMAWKRRLGGMGAAGSGCAGPSERAQACGGSGLEPVFAELVVSAAREEGAAGRGGPGSGAGPAGPGAARPAERPVLAEIALPGGAVVRLFEGAGAALARAAVEAARC